MLKVRDLDLSGTSNYNIVDFRVDEIKGRWVAYDYEASITAYHCKQSLLHMESARFVTPIRSLIACLV